MACRSSGGRVRRGYRGTRSTRRCDRRRPSVFARGVEVGAVKDEIDSLLRGDAEIESRRIRELLIEQGFEGGKTIVDDYVREVRPFWGEMPVGARQQRLQSDVR